MIPPRGGARTRPSPEAQTPSVQVSDLLLPAPQPNRIAPGHRRGYRIAKRALDLVASLLLLLALLPLLVLLALAVLTTSPGPVLFRQVRAGRRGEPFVMLKFRSMRADCDDAAHRAYVTALLTQDVPPDGGEPGVYKIASDPRITRVGGLMRRTSLDELPQLVNVLLGQMSLVGPRPALPWEVELYEAVHRRRLDVPPGLTGLWQVSGRNTLTMREALDLDVEYASRCSWSLDLRILYRTPAALRGRSGAR
ncbi:MAG: sugar transferase [Actinobacteria bacterium]|nr:sugar transferase [Actinomycetota bacterium]MBW3646756.1 sugar transferase [Actinomycetota bacterium]